MRMRKVGDEGRKAGNLGFLNCFLGRRRFAAVTLEENAGCSRKRCLYSRLPQQQLIKLVVLKLDGTIFEIHVTRNGTITDLKQAVERAFRSSPEEDQRKVSWSVVWGHFCLCYEDQKLTDDKAYLRNLGIKDGDQLEFTRHMSISHSPMRKSSASCEKWLKFRSDGFCERLSSKPDVHEEQQVAVEDNAEILEENFNNLPNEDQAEAAISGFKPAKLFRGWVSSSSFRVRELSRGGRQAASSRSLRSPLLFHGSGERRMMRLRINQPGGVYLQQLEYDPPLNTWEAYLPFQWCFSEILANSWS